MFDDYRRDFRLEVWHFPAKDSFFNEDRYYIDTYEYSRQIGPSVEHIVYLFEHYKGIQISVKEILHIAVECGGKYYVSTSRSWVYNIGGGNYEIVKKHYIFFDQREGAEQFVESINMFKNLAA